MSNGVDIRNHEKQYSEFLQKKLKRELERARTGSGKLPEQSDLRFFAETLDKKARDTMDSRRHQAVEEWQNANATSTVMRAAKPDDYTLVLARVSMLETGEMKSVGSSTQYGERSGSMYLGVFPDNQEASVTKRAHKEKKEFIKELQEDSGARFY